MKKTIIAPLVAVAALAAQTIFHVEVKEEFQNDIVNAILTLWAVYGVFVNHKKEG